MKKNNKKVLTAVATLGGSVALLVGGAFAWFSASATATTGGTVNTGEYGVTAALNYWNIAGGDAQSGAWETATNMDVTDMIPGDSRFYAIEITSTGDVPSGTLDMKISSAYTDDGTGDYLLSKMMVLKISTVATLPEPPTIAGGDASVSTAADPEVQTDSIYERTHDADGNLQDIDYNVDNDFTLGETTYVVLEFHFSGKAGNEYQDLNLVLSTIDISLVQNASVQPM